MKAEKWTEIRRTLAGKAIQCHDCRSIRDLVIDLMDTILPPSKESEDAFAKAPDPHAIRAHSEVIMKEPIVRIDEGDGVEIEITADRKAH